jgi:hypothetical protein
MKLRVQLGLIAFLTCSQLSCQTLTQCNREVNYQSSISKLPEDFCMPQGFLVVDIMEEDISNDGVIDRAIKYRKKNWHCGDTVFLSIYLGLDNAQFLFSKTLSNLYTPLIRESLDTEWILNNCDMPDSIARFTWDNGAWVHLVKGCIVVPFAVDLWNGVDFYFDFNKKLNNWVLKKSQNWEIDDGGYERMYLNKNEYKLEREMPIDDFRIVKYLKPW